MWYIDPWIESCKYALKIKPFRIIRAGYETEKIKRTIYLLDTEESFLEQLTNLYSYNVTE